MKASEILRSLSDIITQAEQGDAGPGGADSSKAYIFRIPS